MSVKMGNHFKKEHVFIDAVGNEVKPFSHEVINPPEQAYIPTKQELEAAQAKTLETQTKLVKKPQGRPKGYKVKKPELPVQEVKPKEVSSTLADLVQGKIEQAVAQSLGKIDLNKAIEDAINKAFKN